MRTTIITRGEEWLPSLPLHIEMFKALGFKAPKYAHLPVIMKLDEGKRRKLSKRKDPEASVDYFLEQGYEPYSLLVYLMTIANSNYEDFLVSQKDYNLDHFKFSLKKMSLDGALFDNDKLSFYAKEILSKMKKEEIASKSYEWAKKYDQSLKEFIEKDYSRFETILNIEREKKNPRKDYAKYSDIFDVIKFFDTTKYQKILSNGLTFNPKLDINLIKSFLKEYPNYLDLSLDENTWYQKTKELASNLGFCVDMKAYKANPNNFIGSINDACEILRIALVGRSVTPNLFAILTILGKEEVIKRIDLVLKQL